MDKNYDIAVCTNVSVADWKELGTVTERMFDRRQTEIAMSTLAFDLITLYEIPL